MATGKNNNQRQIVHVPKHLRISFCLKEHTWLRVCIVQGVLLCNNWPILLNSASGIESGHQVQLQGKYIITANIERGWKKRA